MFSIPLAVPRRRTQGTRAGAALERLVRDARTPRPLRLTAAVPFRADAVREAAPELLALAATLRTIPDPPEWSVDAAWKLLTDPAGPVYTDDGSDLRATVRDINLAIQEDRL
jgi:hypothetical protein